MRTAVRNNKRFRVWVSPGLGGWGRVLSLCLLSLAAGWLYSFAVHAADTAGSAVRSGCEVDYPPFCIVHEDGQADGFSVELMRAALDKMGREVTFRTGPWAEVRGWLEHGEVDALPLVGRTPEREEFFDFTVPYMTMHGAIVVREETTDIHSLADLRGRRVGVMKGDNAEEFLRREERGLDILTVSTVSDAFHALAEGRCDAVVIQRLVALRLLKETGLRNLKIVERPILEFSQDFCFAVKKGERDLLSVLNEGLALVVADGTHRRLHAKWFAALELPADRPIVVGGDHHFPPFEFLDDKGRPAGFNVEMTRAIADEMGLDIQIRLGPWADVMEQFRLGEIDALQGLFYSEERDRFADFSPPYFVSHYVSVVRRDFGKPPETLEELSGLDVIVQKNDYIHGYLQAEGLGDRIALADSQENMLREVTEGRRDCALAVRITTLRLIEEHGWSNLVPGRRAFLAGEYCYAVPKGRAALLAQFSEGLAAVKASGELKRLYDKWLGVYEEHSHWLDVLKLSALIVAPLLLLVVLALLWSWSLKRQVRARTRELRESLDRFQSVFEAANVGKSLTLPTGEINANQSYAEMLGYTREELDGRTWQELTPPEDVPETERRLKPLLDGQEDSARFEKRYVRKDGSIVWADVSATLLRDGRHQPLHFITTVVDITERKRAEEALRERTDLLQNITNNMFDMVAITDLSGVFTYAGPSHRILGFEPEELFGTRVFDYVHPDDAAYIAAEFASFVAHPSPDKARTVEYRQRCKAGTYLWLETMGKILFDDEGIPYSILFSSRNITWRRQAEEALQESESRYRSLFECARDGILILDAETGEVVDVNPYLLQLLGYDRGTLLGKPLWDIGPFHDIAESQDLFRVLQEKEYMRYEHLPLQTATGGLVDVEFVSNVYLVNDLKVIQCNIRDITERKRAEAQIVESEERYRLLADNTVDCIWMLNMELVFTYINPAVEAMMGYTPEEWIGSKLSDHCTPERFEQMAALVMEALGKLPDMAPIAFETEMLSKDGRSVPLEIRSTVITSNDGNPLALQGVTRNITERKQAEAERDKLQSQFLQVQKMESVGRLAGGVAHDFNNMLSVILGHAELMFESLPDDSPLRDDLEEIRKAADRSADLTRQLLAFARKQTVAPKVLDLNETITSMLKMLQRLIGEDIDLLWKPGASLAPVLMDPGQVDQILANLAVNARDAIGHEPGKVTIETSKARFDEAYCAEHAGFVPGDYVILAISDDGCGMDEETRANIFEPFFTTKGVGEGTGLGLATLYGIVKQNGGFVNVYSEPGTGTTFRLYFPALAEASTRSIAAAPGPTAVERGDETILVVEDQPALLELARQMLERLGYTVLTAGAPDEALRAARDYDCKIDLLITDVVMPEMNGRVLAEHLQSLYPGLKALFMSGYTANVIAHHGVLDEGVNFIQKPFSLHDLARQVREALLG